MNPDQSTNWDLVNWHADSITEQRCDRSTSASYMAQRPTCCIGTSAEINSWWAAEFEDEWKVNYIKILPSKMEYAINNIKNSEVYIGDTLCNTFPENFDLGEWISLVCEPGPIVGQSIKILNPSEHGLVLCGIEIYGSSSSLTEYYILEELVLELEVELEEVLTSHSELEEEYGNAIT